MGSLLRALVKRFRGRGYLVGRDFEGNRFYEHPSLVDDPRPRRSVKYRTSDDMYKYIGGQRRLAVQWSAWLTHTRRDPPTLEELQADLIRQDRLRHNVALLDARDRQEDQLRLAEFRSTPQTQVELRPPASPEPAPVLPQAQRPPSSHPPPGQPDSWMPAARGRGS
uniref:NADH dehydrogenase [ubiquinone] 1 alpha subcomplex subunit n=1 Tax=Mycena chlorophos TaxID=658473 RepID=A0ABQ0M738_MYCCL|nr:predicted protein [Mycena chlorophos]